MGGLGGRVNNCGYVDKIKDLQMQIKKCRVTSETKTFGIKPKMEVNIYTYGNYNNNIAAGQGKFTN